MKSHPMQQYTLDEQFWTRDAVAVAKDLCGMTLYKAAGDDLIILGTLSDVHAFRQPLARRADLFTGAPGTLDFYSVYNTRVPTIAAHRQSGSGLVTLRAMLSPQGEALKPGQIADLLELDERHGKVRAHEPGANLYFGEQLMPIYKALGWSVEEVPASEIPEAKENLVTTYRLSLR